MGMASTSLMAPLDVVRFALAYLVLIVAPGYAVATLLRPRAPRSERLACAIPCAYALVALSGLATALLRLPFDLRTYGALALPLSLAGGYTLWRRRSDKLADLGRWWLLPTGVALAQASVIMLIYARIGVPSGIDVVSHTRWTSLIAHTHVYPLALLSSHIGANDGGFYPPAFHALTALVLNVAPMPAYRAVFYSILCVIALLPVALFTYVRTVTGSTRLGGLAALASLTFEPLPFFAVSQGLYPLTASLLIVPALALALYHGLGQGDRRAVALAALLGIGLFYTHPTEFVTVALLALAIVPGVLRDRRRWARACGYGGAVLAAWLIAALPALAAIHGVMVNGAQTEIRVKHDFVATPRVDLSAVLNGYMHWVYGYNLSYFLLAMVLLGATWCLVCRRQRGLVLAQVLLFALFVDANSYDLLHRFYVLSFPWALWERLAVTHYWFALPLAALGLDAAAHFAWRFLHTRALPFVAIAAAPVVLLGLIVPLGVAAARTTTYAQTRRIVVPVEGNPPSWSQKGQLHGKH